MLIRITHCPRRTAIIAFAVVATVLGALTTPAAAHQSIIDARLTLQKHPNGNFLLGVDGWAQMGRAEAQRLMDNGHKIVVRLWGDDVASDDLLIGPVYLGRANGLTATPKGLGFRWTSELQPPRLDEDNGFQADELYAGVRLVNPQGSTIAAHESNHLRGRHLGNGSLPNEVLCPSDHIGCRR